MADNGLTCKNLSINIKFQKYLRNIRLQKQTMEKGKVLVTHGVHQNHGTLLSNFTSHSLLFYKVKIQKLHFLKKREIASKGKTLATKKPHLKAENHDQDTFLPQCSTWEELTSSKSLNLIYYYLLNHQG